MAATKSRTSAPGSNAPSGPASSDPQFFNPLIEIAVISLMHFGGSYERVAVRYNPQMVFRLKQTYFQLTASIDLASQAIDRAYNGAVQEFGKTWADFHSRVIASSQRSGQRAIKLMDVLGEERLPLELRVEAARAAVRLMDAEEPLEPPTLDEAAEFALAQHHHNLRMEGFAEQREQNLRALYKLIISYTVVGVEWPYVPTDEHPKPDVRDMSSFEQLPTQVLEFIAVEALPQVRAGVNGPKSVGR